MQLQNAKHPINFAFALTKQHFIHAQVYRAVISQLPVHALVLGKEGERGL